MIGPVTINGQPSDGRIPVTDSSVLRGDGCFEVIKVYGGRPFELAAHLDRLERSATAVDIELPERSELAEWISESAEKAGEGATRVVVTRGSSVPGIEHGPRVIVFTHEWAPPADETVLAPVAAPWHAAGAPWALAGAKILSYAPNMSSTREAVAAGFDDALLVATTGAILEGPTFSLAWMVEGRLETPSLSLGILDSITRRAAIGLALDEGIEVIEGEWPLERLDVASEVMAWSTIREVQSVVGIGERRWSRGQVTAVLSSAFQRMTTLGTDDS